MDIIKQIEELDKQIEQSAEKDASGITEEASPADSGLVDETTPATDAEEPAKDTDGEPAAEEAEDEDPKPAKESKDYVRERRQSRKEMEQELINAKAQLAAMQAIQASKAEPPKQEAARQEVPDPREDPDAYQAYLIAEQGKQLKTVQEQLEQTRNEYLQSQGRAELAQIEADFAKRAPDYAEVMADATARIERSIRAENPNATDAQIKAHIERDKMQAAIVAVKNGQNPAEVMYSRVKALFGYEAKPAKPAVKSEADKLTAVAKNKSLSGSGMAGTGSSSQGHLSKEALMKMTPAEYARLSDGDKEAFLQ